MRAQRDHYGVPALLGNGEADTIPIKATQEGSLCVTDSKKLLKVIRLDLMVARENEFLMDEAYNEITINRLDGEIKLNFVDVEENDKQVSILRPMSITVASSRLWASNEMGEGLAEIWIWG